MSEVGGAARWFDEPMRWLQLNLTPDDVAGTDVAAWQQFWRESKVDGLTISAAGASAFYPTDLPLHIPVPGVEARDLFGELVGAAKELDIRVLARFEPNVSSRELSEAHPEWMSQPLRADIVHLPGVDRRASRAFLRSVTAGRPRPCVNSPYFSDFMPMVMTEIATRYPIDGFYANGWPFIGGGPPTGVSCACTWCLAGWRARGHEELPIDAGRDDPEWDEYLTYVQESYEEVQQLWQRHLRSIRPALTFVCNLHGSLSSGIRWDRFGESVDLYVNDTQGRLLLGPPTSGAMSGALWLQAQSTSIVHAVAGGEPVFHIVGGWHVGNPMLRRLAKEPVELAMMLAQVVGRGARPWCNVAGGIVYDRRWQSILRDFYAWHASIEPYLRNTGNGADVGILWTPEALWPDWHSPGERGPSLVDAALGWHEVLLRARRPYAFVPSFRLAEGALDPFRVIIVPSGSRVDGVTAARLRAHVARGGGLIVGCGVLHPALGPAGGEEILAALAGIEAPDGLGGPHFGAYLDIRDAQHPMLEGVGDTDYLPAGTWVATPADWPAAVGAGRFQAPLPFLADLAVTDGPADAPVITIREQVVHLGTDLDALHGTAQLPDARTLLTNALRAAAGTGPTRCEVIGPGIIDVNVWRQARSITVHLVNLTNPHLYAGPFDEVVPVGPHIVRVHVEPGVAVERVKLLRALTTVPFERRPDGDLIVDVPSIIDFEIVAIEEALT